jgi:hypothetical protein
MGFVAAENWAGGLPSKSEGFGNSLSVCYVSMRNMQLLQGILMSKAYSIWDINEMFSPIPFNENEMKLAIRWIKKNRDRQNDLIIGHPESGTASEDVLFAANLGYIHMTSGNQLNASFLYLKLNAGTSLFGRQKAVYASFHEGPVGDGSWEQGPMFKSWPLAFTAIGNVYRGAGFR